MPKGYWIVRVDITDPEQYKAYVAANADPLKKYGARFLVRAGRFENPEGTSRTRNAVIEFPTYQAALDCWKSPEYQQAIKLRQSVSTADLIVIEGYEGPVDVAGVLLSSRRCTMSNGKTYEGSCFAARCSSRSR